MLGLSMLMISDVRYPSFKRIGWRSRGTIGAVVLATGVMAFPLLVRSARTAFGWREWVGDRGDIVAVDTFGASAPAGELFERFGFTVDAIVRQAENMMQEL